MKKPPTTRIFNGMEYELLNGEYAPEGKGPYGAYTEMEARDWAKIWQASEDGKTRIIKSKGTEWYFIYVR